MITTNLSTLKIHKLSQEQYNRELAAGRLDENAIYLTPDNGSSDGPTPSVDTSKAVGVWVFNDTLTKINADLTQGQVEIDCVGYAPVTHGALPEQFSKIGFYGGEDLWFVQIYLSEYEQYTDLYSSEQGYLGGFEEKTIVFLEEIDDAAFMDWLRANATKMPSSLEPDLDTVSKTIVEAINEVNEAIANVPSINNIEYMDFTGEGTEIYTEDVGILWDVANADIGGMAAPPAYFRVPIAAGEGIEFVPGEEGQIVNIGLNEETRETIENKANKSEGAFFVIGSGTTDSTAKTSTWTGTSDRITEYYDGLAIRYKIGVAGQTTTTLNINNLGAKQVYRFSTTTLTTQFPVGSIINLIYHTDLNGGCWMCNDYDANTNTYQRVYLSTDKNVEYPITARYATTTGASYYAEYGRYSTGVTLNPSTNTITATKFKGALAGNADTATKATQDASGNVITSTYETKADATTKLNEVNAQISQLSSEKVDVEKPIDPNWDKWGDIRYSYGFNKSTQPIFNTVKGTLESDTMLSVRGGKGRWGWHNFEGWSPNEQSRLTMLIGKHHETFGYIQTFSPNGLYADRNRWGWVKLGCDELNEGTDFSKNWTTCYTPITLAPQSAPSSVADYDLNPQLTSSTVPVGTMYFDEEEERIKIYTKTGWQTVAFVGEGGGSGGSDEEEFYEPIPSYRNGYYVEVETSKIVSAGSNGRIAAFRLNKNTAYTVTRSTLSARFRIYLYHNTSVDDAIEKGAVGTLIVQDSSNTALNTLSFTNTDFAMAVVMLSNKADTTTTITAEIVE